jgi:hypothetical protein
MGMANSRDAKPGYPHQPPTEAAPPDDGGHQGSHTKPDDVLVEPDHTRREDGLPPDLQYTNSIPTGSSRAPIGALIGVLVLALALLVFFLYGLYGSPR